jgi:DNA-binding CsgD family transcriptional regulator
MNVEGVIEVAVGERVERTATSKGFASRTSLTRRESEIARLTAEGVSVIRR